MSVQFWTRLSGVEIPNKPLRYSTSSAVNELLWRNDLADFFKLAIKYLLLRDHPRAHRVAEISEVSRTVSHRSRTINDPQFFFIIFLVDIYLPFDI